MYWGQNMAENHTQHEKVQSVKKSKRWNTKTLCPTKCQVGLSQKKFLNFKDKRGNLLGMIESIFLKEKTGGRNCSRISLLETILST